MRNIVLLRDQLHSLSAATGTNLVAVSFDKAALKVLLLASDGIVYCFNDMEFSITPAFVCHAYKEFSHSSLSWETAEPEDNQWFDVSYIAGTGSIVLISRSGVIASLSQDDSMQDQSYDNSCAAIHLERNGYPATAEQVGVIDGGIAAAAWSPDQSSLILVTNNNTMLCMSCTWDVLQEIPIPDRVPGSASSVSWRGDGEGFALVSVDLEDGVCRMRVFNNQLELLAVGRNIAEGPAATMKGVGEVVSYASNGSYIAVCQLPRAGRLQVALVEKNGLRHGDFDLVLPAVPRGYDRWKETSLDWDLPSALLAVGLRAVRDAPLTGSSDSGVCSSSSSSSYSDLGPGLVQFYHRGNYHWYLKQQWCEDGLVFLGFDEEIVNRCYMAHALSSTATTDAAAASTIPASSERIPVLRVVDLVWDICSSRGAADASVAVADGTRQLFTPLGINTVPPPMCKFTVNLQTIRRAEDGASPPLHSSRNSCFWTPSVDGHTSVGSVSWGFASLMDDLRSFLVMYGDAKGQPQTQTATVFDAVALCNATGDAHLIDTVATTTFRAVLVTQQAVGNAINVVLLGSRTIQHSFTDRQHGVSSSSSSSSGGGCSGLDPEDVLLVVRLGFDGQKFTLLPAGADAGTGAEEASVYALVGLSGTVSRMCPVPRDPRRIAVGVNTNGAAGEINDFAVLSIPIAYTNADTAAARVRVRVRELVGHSCSGGGDGDECNEEEEERVRLVASLPEQCSHILFVSNSAVAATAARTIGQQHRLTTQAQTQAQVAGAVANSGVEEGDDVDARNTAVIALSLRNQLYCGESLLASGASSFVYNEEFGMLMYATLSTRPHLHFCSIDK
jgi:hypothetical protein